jgi:hypothetical protein
LRLKSGDIDTGLLELHLGKDGATMNIGTSGADASLGTVGSALKGAAVLGTNALASVFETAADRKDIAETLRSQYGYGYGDAKQKLQLFGIALGLTALNLEDAAKYDAVTKKKGLRREVTLAGYREGMSVDEQLQLGIDLGHEAYRNGIKNEDNEAETVEAVKAHTEMGIRMVQDGKVSVLTESLVKDINAYFDKDGDFAAYVEANYDSSADYMKRKKDGSGGEAQGENAGITEREPSANDAKKTGVTYSAEIIEKVQGLKTIPVPNENQLSEFAKQKAEENGWADITGDQNARDEAAANLMEKVFDGTVKDDWTVVVELVDTYYSGTRPRTAAEGSYLRGENGSRLPDVGVSGWYSGAQYNVWARDPISGRVAGPVIQYLDMDGNGRIDYTK